jgi:hypothetical protein
MAAMLHIFCTQQVVFHSIYCCCCCKSLFKLPLLYSGRDLVQPAQPAVNTSTSACSACSAWLKSADGALYDKKCVIDV